MEDVSPVLLEKIQKDLSLLQNYINTTKTTKVLNVIVRYAPLFFP